MDAITTLGEQVESSLQKASMPVSARGSGHRLRMRPQPLVGWLPQKPRQIDQIEPNLLHVLRSVAKGESPWPLLLTGGAGVGKTCAALCLLDYAGGVYFSVYELCDVLIAASEGSYVNPFADRRMSKIGVWEWLRSTALLVLDELGSRQFVSDFHYENVKRVLDQREGKPLVCISNKPLAELAVIYDDRVASRLAAGTVVELAGADRRLSHGEVTGDR